MILLIRIKHCLVGLVTATGLLSILNFVILFTSSALQCRTSLELRFLNFLLHNNIPDLAWHLLQKIFPIRSTHLFKHRFYPLLLLLNPLITDLFRKPIGVLDPGHRVRKLLHSCRYCDNFLNGISQPLPIIIPVEDIANVRYTPIRAINPRPQFEVFFSNGRLGLPDRDRNGPVGRGQVGGLGGDDILCTNPFFLQFGIPQHTGQSLRGGDRIALTAGVVIDALAHGG